MSTYSLINSAYGPLSTKYAQPGARDGSLNIELRNRLIMRKLASMPTISIYSQLCTSVKLGERKCIKINTYARAGGTFSQPGGKLMLGMGQALQGMASEPGAVAEIPPGSNARPARFTILICCHCLVISMNDTIRSFKRVSKA
jgi:hypothetical protein